VTHAPDPRLGDAIDVYIAPGAARDRTLARDRAWTYNGSPGWAGAMVVDDAGGGPRTWGWLAFAYDVPLWYVWDALYWRDRYRRGDDAPPLDLLRDPITFDDGEDRGALDGVLVYPGPRPSIRLAELRRGLLDRALLEALTACAGRAAADAIVAAVVPATGAPRWPRTDVAWEALRVRILDAMFATWCASTTRPSTATSTSAATASSTCTASPSGSARTQAEYPDLEVTGRVDELTCEIAEGRPPPPKKPKPKHAPSVEFLPTLELPHVPDGTAYPAGRIFHVPFELQAKPDTCVYVQGSITTLPDAQEMVNTDSEGHASGTIAFNAGNFSPNANQLTQLWQMTLIATENPFQGGRSGPVAIRMIRLVSAPKPLF
jgi:hypothetical protein